MSSSTIFIISRFTFKYFIHLKFVLKQTYCLFTVCAKHGVQHFVNTYIILFNSNKYGNLYFNDEDINA